MVNKAINNSFCAEAFEAFKKKDYKRALSLYEGLKVDLNTSIFDINIDLCKRRIKSEVASRTIGAVMFEGDADKEKIKRYKDQFAEKICFIRIIGNDLPGLHSPNQSLENLEFIVENEPEYDGVDKVFLVNRIVSQSKRKKIKKILENNNKKYIEQVFEPSVFVSIPVYEKDLPKKDYWREKQLSGWEKLCWERSRRKLRNAYLMNNNGARNYALKYGFDNNYDWVFPWDGNCFLSAPQLEEIVANIQSLPSYVDYLIVPMERCLENDSNLAYKSCVNAVEEPQLAFRSKSKYHFDPDRVYGSQPKIELLKRLGVPGIWDKWQHEYPWEKMVVQPISCDKPLWKKVSSVFRLSSGNVDASISSKKRSNARAESIIKYIDDVYAYSKQALYNRSDVDFLYYKACQKGHSLLCHNKIRVNDYFENVYLVSLKDDVEKRLKVGAQLRALGVDFEYFEAVDGYKGYPGKVFEEYEKKPLGDLEHYVQYSDYEKQRGRKLIESPGAIGYIFTYIKILKDAKLKGYRSILIIEDDVVFCENFLGRVERFLEKVGDDWRIMHLGASQYGWDDVDLDEALANGYYFPRIHATKGSFSVAFNKCVYDEVIENQSFFEAPFDNLPLGVLYEKYLGKCFVAFPYLVMPDVTKSSIRGGRLQYKHANRVKWWIGDFRYPVKKISIGLVITSGHNLKYLSSASDFRSSPLNICFFYLSDNGLSSLHSFSSISDNYLVDIPPSLYTRFNVSHDLLLEMPKDIALTEELVLESVQKIIFNDFSEGSPFKRVDVEKNEPVEGRVSVILPTYKRPSHLFDAAESVLLQSYKDLELIIVDDNGFDSMYCEETKRIVEKCREKYPERNIKYLKHKRNANGAASRNTGLLASAGEYICFLDDDDVYMPGRISESVMRLKYTNADIGGVYCGYTGWNSVGEDYSRFRAGDLTKDVLALNHDRHYLHTNTVTYKRAAILYINGFDVSYRRHQDLELNLRLFLIFKIDVVCDFLVRLAPKKSSIDNKVYGMDMFDLKCKFLEDYKFIIDVFDIDTKREIYNRNWGEVTRYSKDKKKLKDEIRKHLDNGALQIELLTK